MANCKALTGSAVKGLNSAHSLTPCTQIQPLYGRRLRHEYKYAGELDYYDMSYEQHGKIDDQMIIMGCGLKTM